MDNLSISFQNHVPNDVTPRSTPLVPRALQTIIFGGLAVGIIDGLAAVINSGVRGVSYDKVFHYIASSLLGRDASYNGGTPTVLLGILLHFCVAFGVATGFYLLSRLVPVLLRYAVLSGSVYGILVYFAMSYLIVPLTAVPPIARQFSFTPILIHMFCVGLPVALIARYTAIR